MNNNLSPCQNNVNAKSSNEHDHQCVYTGVYVRIIQMRNCWFQHTQNSHFDSFIRCNIGRDAQDIRSSQKREEDSGLASTLNGNQSMRNGELPFSPKLKKVWSGLEKVADSMKSSRITSDQNITSFSCILKRTWKVSSRWFEYFAPNIERSYAQLWKRQNCC